MASSKINFIASVNDERIGDTKVIADQLKQLGCRIDQVLTFSGIITGSTTTNVSIDKLKIDGIKNVELDRTVRAIQK